MVNGVALKTFATPLASFAFAFAALFILEVVLAVDDQDLLLGALLPARIPPVHLVPRYFLTLGGVSCSESYCAASVQLASACLVDEPIHNLICSVVMLRKPVLTGCAQELAKLFRADIDKVHAAIGLWE